MLNLLVYLVYDKKLNVTKIKSFQDTVLTFVRQTLRIVIVFAAFYEVKSTSLWIKKVLDHLQLVAASLTDCDTALELFLCKKAILELLQRLKRCLVYKKRSVYHLPLGVYYGDKHQSLLSSARVIYTVHLSNEIRSTKGEYWKPLNSKNNEKWKS